MQRRGRLQRCAGVLLQRQPTHTGADETGGGGGDAWDGLDDGDYNFWRSSSNPTIKCKGGERYNGDLEPYCEIYSESEVFQGAIKRCIGPGSQPSGFDPYAPGAGDDWDGWSEEGYPAIDNFVKDLCSTQCGTHQAGLGVNCQDANWTDVRTASNWDPSEGNNCNTIANLNLDDPDGSEIAWELVGGTASPLVLSCDLDGDCTSEFYPNVAPWTLAPDAADFITPETRHAHYLGVEASGSELELDMKGGYDDTNPLFGIAEYTAVDCGDAVCPFFLANLSAYNTTDTWDIGVPTLIATLEKGVSNIQVDLLQSTLGVQNMALGYVAFAPGSLRFRAQFTVSSDPGYSSYGNGTHAFLVENEEYVFAQYDDGELTISHTFGLPSGTNATLTVTVTPDEEPPVAEHDLSTSEVCDDLAGLVLDASRSLSSDPDNDIEMEVWWVNGSPAAHGTVLPYGASHLVSLEVRDERGAVHRTADQWVAVTVGPRCSL